MSEQVSKEAVEARQNLQSWIWEAFSIRIHSPPSESKIDSIIQSAIDSALAASKERLEELERACEKKNAVFRELREEGGLKGWEWVDEAVDAALANAPTPPPRNE